MVVWIFALKSNNISHRHDSYLKWCLFFLSPQRGMMSLGFSENKLKKLTKYIQFNTVVEIYN